MCVAAAVAVVVALSTVAIGRNWRIEDRGGVAEVMGVARAAIGVAGDTVIGTIGSIAVGIFG